MDFCAFFPIRERFDEAASGRGAATELDGPGSDDVRCGDGEHFFLFENSFG